MCITKRHLKLQVTGSEGDREVEVLEQTHRTSEFGHDGSRKFVASNGFELNSCVNPEVDGAMRYFVRGSDRSEDGMKRYISETGLKNLRVAVREYNTFVPTEIIE
jgi:hypothetical protein